MKSAYELAMERMSRDSGPSKTLTDEQRARIADIEARYQAKIAEQRLNFDAKIATAPYPEQAALRAQLAEALADIESKRDSEKEAIWAES